MWLPKLSATSCPRTGRKREQGWVSFPGPQLLLCHAQCGSPNSTVGGPQLTEPHAARLTFLGQHGDEGTDELIVVVGSPLVVNLQRDDKSTNNPQIIHKQVAGRKDNSRLTGGKEPVCLAHPAGQGDQNRKAPTSQPNSGQCTTGMASIPAQMPVFSTKGSWEEARVGRGGILPGLGAETFPFLLSVLMFS